MTRISNQTDTAELASNDLAVTFDDLTRSSTGMHRAIQSIDTQVSMIARTVRMMKLVGLNARVVTSVLADHHGGLDVFTASIGELTVRTEQTLESAISQIAESSGRLACLAQDTLPRGRTLFHEFADCLARLVRLLGAEVSDPSTVIGTTLEPQLELLVGHLGTALIGLQVGDSTWRRLERALAVAAQGRYGGSPPLDVLYARRIAAASQDFRSGVSTVAETLDAR